MRIFYKVILPAVTIISMFGSYPFISNPISVSRIIMRVILCIWFCAFYIKLSKISEHSIYPNIKWTKNDVGPKEKYFYITMGIFVGLMCAIITGWTVRFFIPILSDYYIVLAILNGFIIMVPIVSHYWVLKL